MMKDSGHFLVMWLGSPEVCRRAKNDNTRAKDSTFGQSSPWHLGGLLT